MFTRPKPRVERVRLELLKLDPRLQLRAYPDGQTFDEEYVAHLADVLESGGEFDPLEVVEEITSARGQPSLWVIDGFNRHEAYSRAEAGLVEVRVYPGTFKDAELWALASNARHGRARTSEDCQKAFARLMDSKVMLERVIADRSRYQGTERAIAAACGIGNGIVGKYLRQRNLRVDRVSGKLVPADGPVSPEREARQELVEECANQGLSIAKTAEALQVAPQTVAKDRKALAEKGKGKAKSMKPTPTAGPVPARAGENSAPAPADSAPTLAGAEDALADIQKDLRAVARKVEALLRSKVGDQLRQKARLEGMPFEVTERDNTPDIRPADAAPGQISVRERFETWPTLAGMQAVFSQLAADLAMQEYAAGRG